MNIYTSKQDTVDVKTRAQHCIECKKETPRHSRRKKPELVATYLQVPHTQTLWLYFGTYFEGPKETSKWKRRILYKSKKKKRKVESALITCQNQQCPEQNSWLTCTKARLHYKYSSLHTTMLTATTVDSSRGRGYLCDNFLIPESQWAIQINLSLPLGDGFRHIHSSYEIYTYIS